MKAKEHISKLIDYLKLISQYIEDNFNDAMIESGNYYLDTINGFLVINDRPIKIKKNTQLLNLLEILVKSNKKMEIQDIYEKAESTQDYIEPNKK